MESEYNKKKKHNILSESCNSIYNDLYNYDVIKQIGKGSFSNVFLCTNEVPLITSDTESQDEFFIVKEININELVNKYMLNSENKFQETYKRVIKDKKVSVNITPYKETIGIYEIKNKEYEYYFNRLKQLIESEIEILSNIDHKNIIKFYGYSYNKGIYYLKMEYCNGGDVYEYLKKNNSSDKNSFNGVSNKFLYEFIKQTSDGLVYLHKNNIIHRDIKLHNVLMINDKKKNDIIFKISDFGFACYDLTTLIDNDIHEVMRKKYYKLCGTPYYMAPEIILNMNKLENITIYKGNNNLQSTFFYDKKIDIWSYGICIYELIFNILPFSNIKTIDDLEKFYKYKNIQGVMDKKIRRKSSLSEDFKEILLNMLQVDYKNRYSIEDINKYIYKKINCEIVDRNKEMQDIINCKESTHKLNERMKQHIVKKTIVKKNEDKEESSWERVNKSSSLIMKMSMENGFVKWLLKK
jgi:serine/threonine protein kinase